MKRINTTFILFAVLVFPGSRTVEAQTEQTIDRKQITICIGLNPVLDNQEGAAVYRAYCQIYDTAKTDFSAMKISINQEQVPYLGNYPFGYYYAGNLLNQYAPGDKIQIDFSHPLLGEDSRIIEIPASPSDFSLSPNLPKTGIKNKKSIYTMTWDPVPGVSLFRTGYSVLSESGSTRAVTGRGYYSTEPTYIFTTDLISPDTGKPYEWIAFNLASLNQIRLDSYSASSLIEAAGPRSIRKNN